MTGSNRIAPSYPIANNKKPRPSWRKSGLIKLNFFVFIFIAYNLFSSKALRCDVGRSPGSLDIRTAFPSARGGQWLKDRLSLEITVAGQLPTCPVRLVDGILRNSLFMAP